MTPMPNPFMEIQSSCGGVEGECTAPRAEILGTAASRPHPAGIVTGPQDSISDHGGLAAIEAELSDVIFNMDFMSADPSPPPGPSDLEELQALLTSVRPLHQAAA